MKTYLIIANWLFAFVLLTYNGDSLILVLLAATYFSVSCLLLNRYSRQIHKLINKMNDKIERFLLGI